MQVCNVKEARALGKSVVSLHKDLLKGRLKLQSSEFKHIRESHSASKRKIVSTFAARSRSNRKPSGYLKDDFPMGATVEAHSLGTCVELNGVCGSVTGFKDNVRVVVTFPEARVLAVKPKNLKITKGLEVKEVEKRKKDKKHKDGKERKRKDKKHKRKDKEEDYMKVEYKKCKMRMTKDTAPLSAPELQKRKAEEEARLPVLRQMPNTPPQEAEE